MSFCQSELKPCEKRRAGSSGVGYCLDVKSVNTALPSMTLIYYYQVLLSPKTSTIEAEAIVCVIQVGSKGGSALSRVFDVGPPSQTVVQH